MSFKIIQIMIKWKQPHINHMEQCLRILLILNIRRADMICCHCYKNRHSLWVDSLCMVIKETSRLVSLTGRKWDMSSVRWKERTLKSFEGHSTLSFYRYTLPALILKVDSSKKQRMKKIFNCINRHIC